MREAVLTHESAPAVRTGVHRFAKWPVLSVAGVLAVVHVVLSVRSPYWLDEVYMLAAGKFHLDWGYADQPPMTPIVAAAMDWIAPGVLPVLRLPAVLATAVSVVVAALIARELGGDRRAQVLTAGAFATGLWTNLQAHWVTPYTFEPLLWLTLTWVLVRWIRVRDDRLLLVVGVVAGVTMQTKFQVVLLCVALLATALAFGPRDLLRKPMLWAGVGIALLIALPTLIWQATHGWPQLLMGYEVAEESPVLSGGRSGEAIYLLVYAGVAGTYLLLYGLWRLFSAAELRTHRFLGAAIVLLWIFFIATAGRPYYLIGMYGIGMAAGAVGLQRRRETKRTRRFSWVAWPAYALAIALVVPVIQIGPSLTALFGIPDSKVVAERTANAYHALAPEARDRTAIMTDGYPIAAMIDVEARHHQLPTSYSPNRGYGFFGPPGDEATSVLFVGRDPKRIRPYFTEVRQLSGGDLSIWICSGRTQSWLAIWPRIQHL